MEKPYKPIDQEESVLDANGNCEAGDDASETSETGKSKELKYEDKDMENDEEELTFAEKAWDWFALFVRVSVLILLLYIFICSLTLLSNSFTLIGGRVAGSAFQQNELLGNPICGLMIGVVITAFLQSSSTSTSIIITMVAANLFTVPMAIPMVMGANIGTSVTGVIVAVTQADDREVFKRAFSAATTQDMFNWLTVGILLPIEVMTGYLYRITTFIVNKVELGGDGQKTEFLSVLTKPLTKLIVQIDKSVMGDIAAGVPGSKDKPMLKYYCEYQYVPVNTTITPPTDNSSFIQNLSHPAITFEKIGTKECSYIFHGAAMEEQVIGVLVLMMALVALIGALIAMVKILKLLLAGSMAAVIQKTINADFPGYAAPLTGYATIIVGAIVTTLVQSSSVVVSALTPLVGLGLVTVERVFPMLLGSNIGTTSTAILASFAASGDTVTASFQIALCHLFFNLTGILIWYPIPFMRQVPIKAAKFLGATTSVYRWFAALYLILMFFFLPLIIFGLSVISYKLLVAVGSIVLLFCLTLIIINLLQKKRPEWLPQWLRSWMFLPEPLRSLAPMDRMLQKCICDCCREEAKAMKYIKCKKTAMGSLEAIPDSKNLASIEEAREAAGIPMVSITQ